MTFTARAAAAPKKRSIKYLGPEREREREEKKLVGAISATFHILRGLTIKIFATANYSPKRPGYTSIHILISALCVHPWLTCYQLVFEFVPYVSQLFSYIINKHAQIVGLVLWDLLWSAW